jgi:hypothetical protein
MTSLVRCLLAVVLASALLMSVGAAPVLAQDDPAISVARVQYQGGGDWYSDEESLVELLAFVREQTMLDVGTEEDVVELTSDKLFNYSFLYLTGHGNVTFSSEEAQRLRRYLQRGGFLHIDDNYGLDEYIREELQTVFPEKELVEVPYDHPIYTIRYDFSEGPPKIHEHDGEAAQGYGIFDDHGRLMVFYTHETDLGDGWEPASVHNNSPEKRRAALRMGTNILTYAMTH